MGWHHCQTPSPLIIVIPVSPTAEIGSKIACIQPWYRLAIAQHRPAWFARPFNLVVGMYPSRTWAWREGLQQIFFRMFPIVRYTGYAVLLPKCVNCVLSEEMMSRTTVAPRLVFWESSAWNNQVLVQCIPHLEWCAPVLPTTSLLCASRCRCVLTALDQYSATQEQQPGPECIWDHHISTWYNWWCCGGRTPGFLHQWQLHGVEKQGAQVIHCWWYDSALLWSWMIIRVYWPPLAIS